MYIKNTLKIKIIAATLGLMAIVVFTCYIFYMAIERIRVEKDLQAQQISQTENINQVLNITNSLMFEHTRLSMSIVKHLSEEVNETQVHPARGTLIQIDDKEVYNIIIKDTPQAFNDTNINEQVKIAGGTATIFSLYNGVDFIRITTNIQTNELRPTKAIGTMLDPKGKAVIQLRLGKSYYGIANILDNTFFTGYEPIRNINGQMIGAYYVGYPIETGSLKNIIDNSRILENGFIAILDKDGKIRMHSKHVSLNKVHEVLANSEDWSVIRQDREEDGITIVSAYSKNEVTKRIMDRLVPMTMFTLVAYLVLAMLISFIIDYVVQITNKVKNT